MLSTEPRMELGPRPSIGILGFGKFGSVVARLAVEAGYPVTVAGSGSPEDVAFIADKVAPGTKTAHASEVAHQSDVIVLTVPLNKVQDLPIPEMRGKVVIDAVNHWIGVDGERSRYADASTSTSEVLKERLGDVSLVKALNHVGYHELEQYAAARGSSGRRAIAIAGDDPRAVAVAASFVDGLGFDPLMIGPLATGSVLEPGGDAFGAAVGLEELRTITEPSAQSGHRNGVN